jgi:hypothetical protein
MGFYMGSEERSQDCRERGQGRRFVVRGTCWHRIEWRGGHYVEIGVRKENNES